MKAKKKLLWLAVAAALAVCAVIGAVIVSAAESDTGKNGVFNGSPAHVDEDGNLYIDEINFPDELFRNYVKTLAGGEDGIFTETEIKNVTWINVGGSYGETDESKMISSLSGIEYFTELRYLYCYYNLLTELDVSKNTVLTVLWCDGNQLTELDVSANTTLADLSCGGNQLTELDITSNIALTDLYCGNNQLTELDVTANTALTNLSCGGNQLTKLDVTANTALTQLRCSNNQLTELDLSANTSLQFLLFSFNQLTELDVTANTALTELWCDNNPITELDVSANTALTHFYCGYDLLSSLDVSANTSLEELWCWGNQLTELDVSKNTALTDLSCGDNLLTELDVSANTALTELDCSDNRLMELDVSANTALTELNCRGNHITTLDVSKCEALTELNMSGQTYEDKITAKQRDDGKIEINIKPLVGENGARVDLSEIKDDGSFYSYDTETCVVVLNKAVGNLTYNYLCSESDPQLYMTVTLTGIIYPHADPDTTEWTEVANYTFDEGKADAGLTEVGENFTYADGAVTFGENSYFMADVDLGSVDAISVTMRVKPTRSLSWPIEITSESGHTVYREHYLGVLFNNGLRVERYANPEEKDARPGSVVIQDISTTDMVEIRVVWDADNNTIVYVNGEERGMFVQPAGYDLSIANCIGDDPKVQIGKANWGSIGEFSDGLVIDSMSISVHKIAEPPVTEPDPPVTEPEPPVTEPEPPVTEPEPPVTQPPETTPTETTPAETTSQSEPPVLEDKEESVTVEFPASEAESYSDVKLTVERSADVAKETADSAFAGKFESYVPYEITLTKDGEAFAPVSTLTVNVPVPEGWDASKTTVYYVVEGEQPVDMNASASANGKYVTFTTTHFSTYVLVNTATAMPETAAPAETTAELAETTAAPTETTGAPAETTAPTTGTTTTPPKTGDTNVITIVVAAMCTCAAAAAVAFGTKKRR